MPLELVSQTRKSLKYISEFLATAALKIDSGPIPLDEPNSPSNDVGFEPFDINLEEADLSSTERILPKLHQWHFPYPRFA